MKAVFLKSAQAELDAAVDYYAGHASERVAEAFLQDALQTRQRLIEHPEIGRPSRSDCARWLSGIFAIPSFTGFPPTPSASMPLPTSAAGLDTGPGGAEGAITPA